MSKPQHIRETVVDGVVDSLRKIAHEEPISRWATSRRPKVHKVSRSALTYTDTPFVLVYITGEQKESRAMSGATRVLDSQMTLGLQAWIQDSETSEELSAFLHDIEKVIGLDPSFGGVARDSQIVGNQTVIDENLSGQASVIVSVQVVYGHLDTDPSTLR